MTIVSRLQLDHPALGTAGGAGLHTSIQALYVKIGDNLATRILPAVNLNNAATATVNHDFKTAFASLRYDLYLYDEITFALTRITKTSSPSLSDFTIAANIANPTTQIDITNNSGAQRDLALVVDLDTINILEGDVGDYDNTTAPQDGQAMVYDATTGKWKPGASGDASFKLQSITDPSAVVKGGYIMLDDGRELATHDGAGSASTDFGGDLTVNLDTVLGSNPANGTTYALYVSLASLGAEVTMSDTGRKVYAVTEANLSLSTTLPSGAVDKSLFVPIGFVRSATAGTVWSGAGAAFGTFASRKHDTDLISSTNVYDSGALSAAPSFPISHGLGAVPAGLTLLYEVSTDVWEPRGPVGYLSVTSTQISGDLTALSISASNRVRIVATPTTDAAVAIGPVSATAQGIVTTGRQNVAGLKGFLGGAYSVGNVRASEGAGTTTLTDDDNRHQIFNLSAARTVVLPTTSIKAGDLWVFENRGAFDLSFQSSDLSPMTLLGGAALDATVRSGFVILRALTDAPTTEANWLVVDVCERYAHAMDLTFNGSGGTTAGRSLALERRRNQVTVQFVDGASATTGTGSTALITSGGTELPLRFRPLGNQAQFNTPIQQAGLGLASPGYVAMLTTGAIQVFKDYSAPAFTNAVNAGLGGGNQQNFTFFQ